MDSTEKAFDTAVDTSKLLITLATSIIAFSVTFLGKDETLSSLTLCEKVILLISWVLLLSSATVGVLWTQMAFISILEPPVEPTIESSSPEEISISDKMIDYKPDLRSRKIIYPFNIQSGFFLSGIIFIILFGYIKIF